MLTQELIPAQGCRMRSKFSPHAGARTRCGIVSRPSCAIFMNDIPNQLILSARKNHGRY